MSEEPLAPQSGCWTLASKEDPRWNLRGQYSSMPPAHPSAAMPFDAQQRIEALKTALESDPPQDLRCVWIPYPTPKLRKIFETNVFVATQRQGAYSFLTQESGLTQLNIDTTRGELSFSKPGGPPTHCFPAQFIGLLARELACWQWGWVALEHGSMNPVVLKSVQDIQAIGVRQEIPELMYSEIALGRDKDRPWFSADYLAAAACHLCNADFYVATPTPDAPDLLMYWVVAAPRLLPQPTNEFTRMGMVIKEAMNQWADALRGSDGRSSVQAYAAWKNLAASEDVNHRMRVEAPDGCHILVDIEPSGGVYGIEFPSSPEPEPQRRPWFKRLLR